MRTPEKYGPHTDHSYADPVRLLERRAQLIETLGPPLRPGDRVLDLACGDAGIAVHLLPRGFSYLGVDRNPEMVEAAHRLVGEPARVELGDMNTYRPSAPVAATLCFR